MHFIIILLIYYYNLQKLTKRNFEIDLESIFDLNEFLKECTIIFGSISDHIILQTEK